MQKIISIYKDSAFNEREDYIPSLNGMRFLMVFLVACFHIWQQSWLSPSITIGGKTHSLDYLFRTGYIWVDGMLLLSAFLLYIPYAIAKEKGSQSPDWKVFYKKRLVRIAPSFYLCVFFMLFFNALPNNLYASGSDCIEDLLAHISFTHTLFLFSYYNTPLNGALWTIGVQMQFYFIFPFLARSFRKQPLLTYTLMTATAFIFRFYASTLADCAMYFNQMPAFLDVFANGFLAASIYVSLKRNLKENVYSRIFFSICLVVCSIAITTLLKAQAGEMSVSAIRQGQMNRRYQFSLLISVVIISLPQSLGGIRLIFSNKGAKFLAGISYQFYIYHQLIAVWLKKRGIPPSAYENPHVQGDYLWQVKYIIICLFAAFAVSAAITYLFEKPLSKKLLKK